MGIVVDLDDVMSDDCERVALGVFDHLGSSDPDFCSCVLCADARVGSTGAHSTADAGHEMKRELEDQVSSSQWVASLLRTPASATGQVFPPWRRRMERATPVASPSRPKYVIIGTEMRSASTELSTALGAKVMLGNAAAVQAGEGNVFYEALHKPLTANTSDIT